MEDNDRKTDHVTLEHLQRDSVIKAYIANAEEYEKGNLIGIWQPLPTTKDEFSRTLDAIGVHNGDYIADDFETTIPGLEKHLSYSFNIDEVNYLSAKLTEMQDWEQEAFSAVMFSGRHCDSVMDIINVVENIDLFDANQSRNAKEFGEILADIGYDLHNQTVKRLEAVGNQEEKELAEYVRHLENYYDATAYANKVVKEENGVFTEGGYLRELDGFKDVYMGIVPPKYRVFVYPQPKLQERPSALHKLFDAKKAVTIADAEKVMTDKKASKSTGPEL